MVQVTGVGMGLLGALFLVGVVFLATGRGSETEALWVFPAWAAIFVYLIWGAIAWRQVMARGFALLGAEFLALPPAWLLYQGLPSLSASDPRLPQTLSVLALGLGVAAASVLCSFLLGQGQGPASPARIKRPLVIMAGAAFGAEIIYGLVLLGNFVAG